LTASREEPVKQMTVEEAEAAYIKNRLNSALESTSFISNTHRRKYEKEKHLKKQK